MSLRSKRRSTSEIKRTRQASEVPPPPPRYACLVPGAPCWTEDTGPFDTRAECDADCPRLGSGQRMRAAPPAFYEAVERAREAARFGTPAETRAATQAVRDWAESGELAGTLYDQPFAGLHTVWLELLQHAPSANAIALLRVIRGLGRHWNAGTEGRDWLEEHLEHLATPGLGPALQTILGENLLLSAPSLVPFLQRAGDQLVSEQTAQLPPRQRRELATALDLIRALRTTRRAFAAEESAYDLNVAMRFLLPFDTPEHTWADWVRLVLATLPAAQVARGLARFSLDYWLSGGLTRPELRAIADQLRAEGRTPPGWFRQLPAPAPPAPPAPFPRWPIAEAKDVEREEEEQAVPPPPPLRYACRRSVCEIEDDGEFDNLAHCERACGGNATDR